MMASPVPEVQDGENGEANEEGEESLEMRVAQEKHKKVMKKLHRLQLRHSLKDKWRWSPLKTGLDPSSWYESKLRKLRSNNQSLAKALAEQKMESQQWYTEVVSLKAELQEVQERLLRFNDKDSEAYIEREVERRLREQSEPLDAAISAAMENVVVVVESLSKAKKIAALTLRKSHSRSSQNSRSSSSNFNLPRTSGSRVSFGANSNNNSSPRQSVVLPMVSGHVLQPAMVAIPKIDVMWRRRKEERIKFRQEETLDMSIIGEQSLSAAEDNESSSHNVSRTESEAEDNITGRTDEDTSDSPVPELEDTSENSPTPEQRGSPRRRVAAVQAQESSTPPSSPRHGGRARYSGGSRGAKVDASPRGSPTVTRTESKESQSSTLGKDTGSRDDEGTLASPRPVEEDPLEGPSWWYHDLPSHRGLKKARGQGRRRGRGRPSKSSRSRSSLQLSVDQNIHNSLSENEEENMSSKPKRSRSSLSRVSHQADVHNENTSTNLVESKKSPTTAASATALDASYIASPATMLSRLEALEAKSGRRSRRGKSLKENLDSTDRASNPILERQKRSTQRSLECLRSNVEQSPKNNANESQSLHLQLNDSLSDADPLSATKEECKQSVLMPPPSSLPPSVPRSDYIITDNDLTCVGDVSMDMTECISKILVEGTARKLMEKTDDAESSKKFFKANGTEPNQKDAAVTERTPFDMSLMEATAVGIEPFSSLRTQEKENLPPDVESIEKDKSCMHTDSSSLRRVSVVLEDVMRSPGVSDKYIPFPTPHSVPSDKEEISEDKRKNTKMNSDEDSTSTRGVAKRKNSRCINLVEDSSDDDDSIWSPSSEKKSNRGKRNTYSQGRPRGRPSGGSKKKISFANVISHPSRKGQRKKKDNDDSSAPEITPDNSISSEQDADHDVNVLSPKSKRRISVVDPGTEPVRKQQRRKKADILTCAVTPIASVTSEEKNKDMGVRKTSSSTGNTARINRKQPQQTDEIVPSLITPDTSLTNQPELDNHGIRESSELLKSLTPCFVKIHREEIDDHEQSVNRSKDDFNLESDLPDLMSAGKPEGSDADLCQPLPTMMREEALTPLELQDDEGDEFHGFETGDGDTAHQADKDKVQKNGSCKESDNDDDNEKKEADDQSEDLEKKELSPNVGSQETDNSNSDIQGESESTADNNEDNGTQPENEILVETCSTSLSDSKQVKSDVKEAEEMAIDGEPERRQRRAASKVVSFKEASLNKKLRQGYEDSTIVYSDGASNSRRSSVQKVSRKPSVGKRRVDSSKASA